MEDYVVIDKGLDKSIIEMFFVVVYGVDFVLKLFKFDLVGGNECVVCLSEFVMGEKLCLLFDCYYGFYFVCIDIWLFMYMMCFVCCCCVFVVILLLGICSDDSDDFVCVVVS